MAWTRQETQDFALVLVGLGETFNEPVSPIRAELYCEALEDLPFDRVRAAAREHLLAGKFFPRPAELREFVLGNTTDQAEMAWVRVQQEVSRVGWAGTPVWPDERTERAALQLFGGWRALCEHLPSGGPELLGFRKQFISLFGALVRQDVAGLLPPSRDEARARLEKLALELEARHLPAKGL